MDQTTIFVVIIIVVIFVLMIWWIRNRNRDCPHLLVKQNDNISSLLQVKSLREKPETIPVFLRGDDRPIVTAPKIKNKIELPRNFDARTRWSGWITPVSDQGTCGSCWAFSSSGVFGDRIRIATNGQELANDQISQYHLAACMKCGTNSMNKVCTSVCSGNYMDEVVGYLKTHGAYGKKEVGNDGQYICYKPVNGSMSKLYKASSSYRVNPYSVYQLSDGYKRAENEYSIMYDIYHHGPVTATIQVFDPMARERLHQNFYLYQGGIYGTNWNLGDPRESDGYHAIAVIGWGEELVNNVPVKYWIIRNSWGPDWGENGYGRIIRGENRIIIESDLWTISY